MNLFNLYAKIALDTSEYESGLEKAGGSASSFGSKLKSGLATAAKVGMAAVGAAATGIAALTKSSVENYSEYEQLVGGVDTLFKQASSTVQKYAANAYKTAGMSANEYMSTVTSFSASLLQSLGGDTEAAAQKADQAITDMSDNANKMGTDMSLIQNAYQGFAKQNYTMLDNLKLGYGGTQEEMKRLLDDATALSGVKYDISSYADVVDAIHVIQTEMGITGTTAKEASSTIQGSILSMKSAWTNLVTGLADPNADIGLLVTNMIETVVTAAGNIIPKIGTVLNSILPAIQTDLPLLMTQIVTLLNENLPALLNAAVTMLTSVVQGVLPYIPQMINTVLNVLISNLPLVVDMAVQIVNSLIQGLSSAMPTLIPAAVEAITTIVSGLLDNIPMLLKSALQLIISLAEGLIKALPKLIARLLEIINKMVTFFVSAGPQLAQAGIQLLVALIKNLPQIIVSIVKAVPQIISALAKGFSSGVSQMVSVGTNLIKGIWRGIGNAASWLWGKVKGFASQLMSKIKSSLGIYSPSTETAWVGEMLVAGLTGSIEDNGKKAVNAADSMVSDIMNAMNGMQADMSMIPTDYSISKTMTATVNSSVEGFQNKIDRLEQILITYLPQLASMQVVLDNGKVAGELAPAMNAALGRLDARKLRTS